MVFYIRRTLFLCATLVVLALKIDETHSRPQVGNVENPPNDEDEDSGNSSSEESMEESIEITNIRERRSIDDSAATGPTSRAAIPGLPDPATIIKIAELFETIGEKVVPILLESILPSSMVNGERLVRDLKLLKNFKNSLEQYSDEVFTN